MNGASAFGEMRQTRRIIETAARFSRWRLAEYYGSGRTKVLLLHFEVSADSQDACDGGNNFPEGWLSSGARVSQIAAKREKR